MATRDPGGTPESVKEQGEGARVSDNVTKEGEHQENSNTDAMPIRSNSITSHEIKPFFPKKGEENVLQSKLLSLDLNREDIHFILEQGDRFLERPPQLLARRLSIHVNTAKASIEILKCFKNEKEMNNMSEDDQMQIENCLEDPEFSTPEDIVLLTDIPLQTVTLYLQNRPLDDKQKTDIKERLDTGTFIQGIAMNLGLQLMKVQEYVENTFITFTGTEGKRCFDIIHKNFEYSSKFQLRKLVISTDLKLQDQLCCVLLERNEREHVALKKYFQKFEESKSFFEIKPIYSTIDDIQLISDSKSFLSRETNTEFLQKAEKNILQGKLLSLNLSREDIHFILEQGDRFLERPSLLAKKLKIEPEIAKASIEALKCFKNEKEMNNMSEDDRMQIENCLRDPEISTPEDIALFTDIPLQTVTLYLQNRPLDDEEKAEVKKKVDIGNSVREIAILLKKSPNRVQEYVENTFITFTGTEGKRCFDIIHKNFKYSSKFQIRKLVISTDLKLQDQLCYVLLKRNEREHVALKRYFQKFEESKSFFEIKPIYLTIDDIHLINQSSDIELLSNKLNKPARIIREYLAQYKPYQVVQEHCEVILINRIQELLVHYGMEQKLPFQFYRMIVTHPFEDMMNRAQTRQYLLQVFEDFLPLAFYYLKCSLPFTEITQMLVSTGKSNLTTHELFHLIFQQSDPVLRAFCIEHYSFSNPVPFYYPNLHTVKQNKFQVKFAICSELWYSIQQYNGLISFGLGRACWNPIGKSHLLDLIFETDFVRGNPQNSAFHHNSIDIQMTNNLFGDTKEHPDESIKWAFIDCHGNSNRDLIKLICQQMDIALIQVCYQDFQNHKELFRKEVSNLTSSIKHVYIFIRDYNRVEVEVDMSNQAYKLIYIPNLTKPDTNIDSVKQSVRKIGYEILHLNSQNSKTLGNEFIENVMSKIDNANLKEILVEKSLVRKITECVKKSTQKLDFSYLQYYPLFVEYMSCYYQASYETNQKTIDKLNSECDTLITNLNNVKMGEVVKHFSRIIERENSGLIIWRLSQALSQLSKQVVIENKNISSKELLEESTNKYSLEILWREVLLSSKYGKLQEEGRDEFLRNFALSYSNHVERGEPFELIDGDNLRYFNQDIDYLLYNMYQKRLRELEVINEGKDIRIKQAPIVVSIFGPQSSGKSTLLNYCFGCKFLTSPGRCTRGIYASLAKLSKPVNCSDQFLILDTEGLDAIERNSLIQFDRTMVLFCLAVSQVVIINVKGDIGKKMQNLLQICAYSLNKLKVRRVTAPQIFFVLNQQADPNTANHLNSIKLLMERLNKELTDREGKPIIVSELIKISTENLFVLPSAFNSEHFNKHSMKLFDSKVIKLSPTSIFADKCSDLRMAIINKLDCMPVDERTSFETMSEWLEISGTIWDTIIKYQDIVKYGNVEEMMCNDLLRNLISELMNKHIYTHKPKFIERTERLSSEIREMDILENIDDILERILTGFAEFFQPYKNTCLKAYKERCQEDILLNDKTNLCKEHELNLDRLMYMEYVVYEDKVKFQISAVKIEKRIHESMKKFQEAIIKNVDSYLEQSLQEQKSTFEHTWAKCFEEEDYSREEVDLSETFERLYSLFKMELGAMENQTEILNMFRKENFQMENVITSIQDEILIGFLGDPEVQGEKHLIFPINEHNTPLKEMTPFPTKPSLQYLAPDCIYKIVTERSHRKTKIKLLTEIPYQCKPLVEYCSGYYNYPDIQWKGWRMDKQIFHLTSLLKSPRNPQVSTWQLLIEDIATINKFIDIDPTVSPVTIKEIVNHLYSILQVVNYELSFIQAKLTNTAERTISKLVFAFAFKSLLEIKRQNRFEHAQKKKKEKQVLLQYFLQKIEVCKMFRGGLDRDAMKETDLKLAQKFALDFLGAVKRGVLSAEQPSIENYFNERKEELSHKNLLNCGNAKVSIELNRNPGEENVKSDNFVVQYICNRNVELRKLFFQKWEEIREQLHSKLVTEITNKFNKQLAPLKGILSQLLVDLVKSRDKTGHKAFDSDNNFEMANMKICDFDSEIQIKEGPFKAAVLYLQMYLDPNISPEEFSQFFQNEFEVEGVKMKTSDTYKLCSKSSDNPNHILDQEMFKKMKYTKMFSSDNIFNISDYVTQFLFVLENNSFNLTEEDFAEFFKLINGKFERDALGCPNQCPSCRKLCERELHPNDGLCQIKTGHQICSMGGKVWNNEENNTAVLHMCDDYQDYTKVVIQGRTSTWGRFKAIWGDRWDWTMPQDEEYLDLQKNNRENMKNIWNKFGKGILNFHHSRGKLISFVPYTASHDLYNRMTLKYYICFVIDGTVSMATEIKKARISVGQFINKYKELAYNSEFRVVIYRDHCDKHVIETFPNDKRFTIQHIAVQDFLSSVKAVGGGDFPEAVLDGLATAATESDWKSARDVKNIVIHIYDAPPHGDFPYYNLHDPKSNLKYCCCCNQNVVCPFIWERDVWDGFKKFNIHYHGINTGKRIPAFENTMKAKLGELCGEFQAVGQEKVNDAVLQIFIRI